MNPDNFLEKYIPLILPLIALISFLLDVFSFQINGIC